MYSNLHSKHCQSNPLLEEMGVAAFFTVNDVCFYGNYNLWTKCPEVEKCGEHDAPHSL